MAFAQYLREPWYEILTEWDEIEFEDEEEEEQEEEDEAAGGGNTAEVSVLLRRSDDDWSVASWQLSRYNGRWLTDSLTIN